MFSNKQLHDFYREKFLGDALYLYMQSIHYYLLYKKTHLQKWLSGRNFQYSEVSLEALHQEALIKEK
jgi:hypothetical protein